MNVIEIPLPDQEALNKVWTWLQKRPNLQWTLAGKTATLKVSALEVPILLKEAEGLGLTWSTYRKR